MFFTQIARRVQEKQSLLVAGIDPHPELLSEPTPEGALRFGLRLAEAVVDQVVAFKINVAFFEALGEGGWRALARLRRALPPRIPVLLDAKRGDIPSTARRYAHAFFQQLNADAVTLSPYLGRDALEPFLEYRDRGVFLLVRTSNPGAHEPQAWPLATGEALYQALARWIAGWASPAQVGLVVGATQPLALQRVRAAAPAFWILAPGVGPQGASLEAAYRAGRREDGLGLLFPVSRRLARAARPREEARRLREAMWHLVRSSKPTLDGTPLGEEAKATLARLLVETGCVRFGEFVLKSGQTAPIYFDLRRLVGFPRALQQVAYAYAALLRPLNFDRIAALPYAALPLGTAVGLLFGWPVLYPRKEAKPYGTRAHIEGPFAPGERAVLLDDVLTTGLSKLEALQALRAAGLHVQDVVVLIDREAGGREVLEARGLRVHAALGLRELLGLWQASALVPGEALERVERWLQAGA